MEESIRKTIIYVDDVMFNLVRLRDLLKGQYDIFPAQSVTKMFDILKQLTSRNRSVDIILLDLNMPDVDGYEAIKMLKANTDFADIPVILLTAQTDDESLAKGVELGAVGHVGKPYTAASLVEAIEKV